MKDAYKLDNLESIKEEIGDLLFTIVNLSRFLKINPEEALKLTIRKFENRFYKIESTIKSKDKTFNDFSSSELLELWKKSK